MLIRKATSEQIQQAAESVGVRLYEFHKVGTGYRFQLKPGADIDKYKRTSAGYGTQGRRVFAVCWHGFRDFMQTLYKSAPDAVIITSMARYDGLDGFNRNYMRTDRNIGSQICPMTYTETCDCMYVR